MSMYENKLDRFVYHVLCIVVQSKNVQSTE
jgi:hypothetical protein